MDETRAKELAELEVRRYFDYYLNETFPKQVAEIQEHARCLVEKHNMDAEAHGGVQPKFTKFMWILAGLSLAGGAGAGTVIAALTKAASGL